MRTRTSTTPCSNAPNPNLPTEFIHKTAPNTRDHKIAQISEHPIHFSFAVGGMNHRHVASKLHCRRQRIAWNIEKRVTQLSQPPNRPTSRFSVLVSWRVRPRHIFHGMADGRPCSMYISIPALRGVWDDFICKE